MFWFTTQSVFKPFQVQKSQNAAIVHNTIADNSSNNITCESALYNKNNSICKQYLQSYTNCLKGSHSEKANPDVYVSSPFERLQAEAEFKINLLSLASEVTKVNVRPQCRLSLEPLICLYYIHLCDNGTDIGPNQEQCGYVSNACDKELEQIKILNLPISVEEFLSGCVSGGPFDKKNCIITGNYTINNCYTGFYLNSTENGRCQPECNVWSPYEKKVVLITDVMTIFAVVICLISGGSVLVLSWIRRQKL